MCWVPMHIEESFDMSCVSVICYNVPFKLRAVAAAKGKSKEAAAWEVKVDA